MPKSNKGFGLGALTPQGQKKRFDYRSKSVGDDDGGNDTLELNDVRDKKGEHTVSVER